MLSACQTCCLAPPAQRLLSEKNDRYNAFAVSSVSCSSHHLTNNNKQQHPVLFPLFSIEFTFQHHSLGSTTDQTTTTNSFCNQTASTVRLFQYLLAIPWSEQFTRRHYSFISYLFIQHHHHYISSNGSRRLQLSVRLTTHRAPLQRRSTLELDTHTIGRNSIHIMYHYGGNDDGRG